MIEEKLNMIRKHKDLIYAKTIESIMQFILISIIFAFGKGIHIALQGIISRQLSTSDFGKINVTIASCQILAIVMTLGAPIAGTRFVSMFSSKKDWPELSGYLIYISFTIAAIFITNASIALFLIIYLPSLRNEVFILILILLPAWCIMSVRSAIARGLGYLIAAFLPWEIATPILSIITLLLFPQHSPFYVIITLVSYIFILETIALSHLFSKIFQKISQVRPHMKIRSWLRVSISLLVYQVIRLSIDRGDIIFIAYVLGFKEAGIYAVAQRLSMAIQLLSRISTTILAPRIASAYGNRNTKFFNIIFPILILTGALGTLAIFALHILSPHLFKLFNIHFGQNERYLVLLLSVTELINAVFTPFCQALLMTRFERIAAQQVAVAAALYFLLLPFATLSGGLLLAAALKTLLALAYNTVAVWSAYRRLPMI